MENILLVYTLKNTGVGVFIGSVQENDVCLMSYWVIKNNKKIYISILLFMGTLRLSLYYMEKMVWILFIVQIAWHDRGLLKQFPKAVCIKIFIC